MLVDLRVNAHMRSYKEHRLSGSRPEESLGVRILFVTDAKFHCLRLSKLPPSTVHPGGTDTIEGALLQIEREPPDANLIELTMEDGVHATQRIAARFPGDRVLALSMSGRGAEVVALARAGISAYLPRAF